MTMLGELEWFLGIRVLRDRQKRLLWLSQEAYIEKMANKFGIKIGKKKPDSPMNDLCGFPPKRHLKNLIEPGGPLRREVPYLPAPGIVE